MEIKKMRVKLTFQEPILGSLPANENIYRDYIATKAPDPETVDDEVAAVSAEQFVEKAITVFPRTEDGTPCFYDYQIKGFFKDTCGGLRRVSSSRSNAVKAFKKEIDKLIFVAPRMIPISYTGEVRECQRPLRASTPQGERVSIAISEEIPSGASVTFDILLFDERHKTVIREWLDYGMYSGLGQWRNSGKGRFTWEEVTA